MNKVIALFALVALTCTFVGCPTGTGTGTATMTGTGTDMPATGSPTGEATK